MTTVTVKRESTVLIESVANFIKRPSLKMIIQDTLPAIPAYGFIYGPSASGKTFEAVYTGMCACTGEPWHGKKVKNPTGVVYVCAEGQGGFPNRIKAYCQYHDIPVSDLKMEIVAQSLDLMNDFDQMIDLVEAIKSASSRIGDVGLIIIDTMNRVFGGGNENASDDTGKFLKNIQSIAEQTNAFVLIVHHSGKNEENGARGHSSLRGNAELEIKVSNDHGNRKIEVSKVKDGKDGATYGFRLERVELGEDEDGDKITSCVAVPAHAPPKQDKRKLPPAAEIALRALNEVIGDAGEFLPATSTVPRGVKAVRIDAWKSRYRLRYGDDKEPEALRKSFNRAKEYLLAKPHVCISEPWVWTA